MNYHKIFPALGIAAAVSALIWAITKMPAVHTMTQRQAEAAVADCQQRGGFAVVKTSGFYDQSTDRVICYGTALGRITYEHDTRTTPPPLTPEKEKVRP